MARAAGHLQQGWVITVPSLTLSLTDISRRNLSRAGDVQDALAQYQADDNVQPVPSAMVMCGGRDGLCTWGVVCVSARCCGQWCWSATTARHWPA